MIQFPNTLIAHNYERCHTLENQVWYRESRKNLDWKVHLELSSPNFCSEQV